MKKSTDGSLVFDGAAGNNVSNKEHNVFMEGRAVFIVNSMSNIITKFREMDDDYIIIPMPKNDESQEKYRSFSNPWCLGGISVPVNCSDMEKNGVLLEALAYKSYELVRPAQYDITVKQKVVRNSENEKLLDLIYNNVYSDNNFVSSYAEIENKTNVAINELYANLEK